MGHNVMLNLLFRIGEGKKMHAIMDEKAERNWAFHSLVSFSGTDRLLTLQLNEVLTCMGIFT